MQPSRREDLRLIAGHGRYSADWNLPRQLHAAVLRSPHAAARIVRINAAPAMALAGVKAVLTYADVERAGYKGMIGGVATKDKHGKVMKKPEFPVLAHERVCYVGQAVAFVVAESAALAQDAADLIEVEYEASPAVVTWADAVAPGAPLVHAAIAGNLSFTHEHGDEAATAAAFAKARYVTEVRADSQRLVPNPMEPRACVASFDAKTGRYLLHAASQGLIASRVHLQQITGVPAEQIDLVVEDVGGSFGIRSSPYPEYILSMLASKTLGVPVKCTGSRTDTFLSDCHGRALSLVGEVALDADGKILAVRWEDEIDLGAYAGPFGAFIGTNNVSIMCAGVYHAPAVFVRSRLAYTNTTPVSSYRGAGRPDIAYALERLIDQAAVEHSFDKLELRRKNFILPTEMPHTTAAGQTYDCGDFPAVLDHAVKTVDWSGFAARRVASEQAGKLRGIGLASYIEAAAAGAQPKDQTAARVAGDGTITIYCMAGGSGQGHETTFVTIFADGLGIDGASIQYRASDPAFVMVGNGTGGSRTAGGQGSSFKLLAQALIDKATPHAASALGVNSVSYANGVFSGGGKTVALAALAKKVASAAGASSAQTGSHPAAHPFDCEAEGSFGATYPNGCHIAEIEVDPDTGVTELVRYVAVDDLGNILQPVLVEGQVHGGVAQGWGQMFGEHAVYDRESGQFLTASFMDYPMPRAGWLPKTANFDRIPHPVPTTKNLLGAKGVGESGCSGSLPALMNAMMDAARSAGVRQQLQMPVTPAVLWRALKDARAKTA